MDRLFSGFKIVGFALINCISFFSIQASAFDLDNGYEEIDIETMEAMQSVTDTMAC